MELRNDQVDAAIDFVIRHGAENRGQTVYYTQVFEAAGVPPPQALTKGGVSAFMERFHFRLQERGLPPLDALVVVVAGERQELPGAGYFRVNKLPDPLGDLARIPDSEARGAMAFWEEQKRECHSWGQQSRRRRPMTPD